METMNYLDVAENLQKMHIISTTNRITITARPEDAALTEQLRLTRVGCMTLGFFRWMSLIKADSPDNRIYDLKFEYGWVQMVAVVLVCRGGDGDDGEGGSVVVSGEDGGSGGDDDGGMMMVTRLWCGGLDRGGGDGVAAAAAGGGGRRGAWRRVG
ncbi:hypothetical protein Tco_0189272 [Tanacetum coccineum]